MKKRIGTLKGKPIVEGGGSNIIKKNEININDIGNSSSDSNDGDISYFGLNVNSYEISALCVSIFPLRKIVDYRNNLVDVQIPNMSIPDNSWFLEFGGNMNDKCAYLNGNWINLKELFESKIGVSGMPIEVFKPISKEEFYRTNYTKEEAEKIAEDYYNYALQFAPSKP